MNLKVEKKYLFIIILLVSAFNSYTENKIKTESKSQSQSKEEKTEVKKTVIPEYQDILDSSGRLHVFYYKDENIENLTLNNPKNSNQRSVTISSKEKTRRLFYDSNYRLNCAEYWTIKDKSSESGLNKIVYYFYNDGSNLSEIGKFQYVMETKEYLVNEKKYIQVFYDVKNRVVEKNEYVFITDEDKLNFRFTKSYIETDIPYRREYSFLYKYDQENNIQSEEEFHLEYRSSHSIKNPKINVRKNTYEYIMTEVPPVTSFYENNILRMKTVYSSEKDYVQTVYFDNDTYVKVQYKEGKKVSETFYVEGRAYE